MSLPERLAQLWWLRAPRLGRRLAVTVMVSQVDGLFVTAWPLLAAIAPPAVFFVAFFVGFQHPGFETAFSESTLFMLLATAVGVLSANLGLCLLAGFAAGDLATGLSMFPAPGPGAWIVESIPLLGAKLMHYAILGLLTVKVPILAKSLAAAPVAWVARFSSFGALAVAVGLFSTLCGALAFFWTQAVPILIRPVFTWTAAAAPTVAAIEPLQKNWWVVTLVAVAAAVFRIVIQAIVAFRPNLAAVMDRYEQALNEPPPTLPLTERMPSDLRAASRAVWSTMILSGMIEAWWQALVLAGTLFALQRIRPDRLSAPGPVRRFLSRTWPLARFAVGVAAIVGVSSFVIAAGVPAGQSFLPMLILTSVAVAILVILDLGAEPVNREKSETQP